jgi:hypothetical protein
VVHAWKWIPIFLCVEKISVSTTFDNIFGLMLEALLDFGGLKLAELGAKLVNMGCESNNMFHGH